MTFVIVIAPWSWKSVILLNQIYFTFLPSQIQEKQRKRNTSRFAYFFCNRRRSSSISMHFLPAPATSEKTSGSCGGTSVQPSVWHLWHLFRGQIVVNAHRTDPTWGLMSSRAVAKDSLACWHKHLRVSDFSWTKLRRVFSLLFLFVFSHSSPFETVRWHCRDSRQNTGNFSQWGNDSFVHLWSGWFSLSFFFSLFLWVSFFSFFLRHHLFQQQITYLTHLPCRDRPPVSTLDCNLSHAERGNCRWLSILYSEKNVL